MFCGLMQVWRVEDFDLKPVDKSVVGEFYSGDCYVIQYTYEVHGRPHHLIYYWLVSAGMVLIKRQGHDEALGAGLRQ